MEARGKHRWREDTAWRVGEEGAAERQTYGGVASFPGDGRTVARNMPNGASPPHVPRSA